MKRLLARLKSPKNLAEASDEDLMVAVAGDHEDALQEIVRRYQGVLLNLFARLGAQRDEADDAVQETLLRLHAYRRRYEPTGNFRTFLYTVARRAWLDLCRRRERQRRREARGVDLAGISCPKVLSNDERMDLHGALDDLSEAHRMVLVLSVFGGLRYEEISEVMGIPEGTVKSRVFHGLRKLRARLTVDETKPAQS